MKKYKIILILFFCITITGCDNTDDNVRASSTPKPIETNQSPAVSEEITPMVTTEPISNEQGVTLDKENDNILGYFDNTQYFWRMENDDCVLYAIDDGEQFAKQLAIFPPMDEEDPNTINNIIHFGVCGDWLIASVGHYEGSGHYFYGDFVRLKKDGSELEHLYLTDDDTFNIIDDWIYYNYWTVKDIPEDDPYGCYRIRPDGTEKEYLGDSIRNIYLYENGFIYGEHATSKMVNDWNPVIDLVRCDPDGSNVVTLFQGDSLPEYESSDFIEYSNIKIIEDNVFFTASVHGYSEGDPWSGHYNYTADYSVKSDGSNLTRLKEESYNP